METLETAETTYNFEVADFHTYYVTETNVLVHNRCNKEWNNERRKYWRKQAKKYEKPTGLDSETGTYKVTKNNLDRMKRGSAPFGTDGKSVHLHHNKGIDIDFYDYREITYTDHYSHFKELHPWVYNR